MKNDIKINQTGRSLLLSCAKDTPSSFERRVQNRYMSTKVASRFAQTGRSMIEMLGVLAIIGVLSVGGIAGYSKAMMKHRVNKTIAQITMIATNIRTLFGPQGNYNGLNEEIAVKAKAIPEEMVFTDARGIIDLRNAFGRSFGIDAAYKYSTENNTAIAAKAFLIYHFYGIPQDACITLATQDWNDDAMIFSINDGISESHFFDNCKSVAGEGGAVHCVKDGPMSVSDATQACSEKDNNRIEWMFY